MKSYISNNLLINPSSKKKPIKKMLGGQDSPIKLPNIIDISELPRFDKMADISSVLKGGKLVKKKSITKKPTTKKSITKKPTTKKSITKKPSTKKPTTKKPTTKKPATKKPTTKKPATKKPAIKRPTTKKTRKGGAESTYTILAGQYLRKNYYSDYLEERLLVHFKDREFFNKVRRRFGYNVTSFKNFSDKAIINRLCSRDEKDIQLIAPKLKCNKK